jgi:hypothetical protein
MFYEVRIFSPKGNLKKVVSTQELSKTYWDSFNKIQLPNLESLHLLREHKKQISATDYHADNNFFEVPHGK